MNKRKNAAIRKHRLTAQRRKARQKGIDPSADQLWNVGTWEDRRSRAWRQSRPTSATGETATTARAPRRPRTRAASA